MRTILLFIQLIMKIFYYIFEIIISFSIYLGFYYVNELLTKDFILNNHVSWLFLPAGIRIMLILVFTYTGAIGLSIASLVIGFISNAPYDLITASGIALICGFAPLLSRLFVIHHFQVHPNLNNLTTRQLIWIILIFALFNSGLHQLWFVARSLDTGGWNYFIAMLVGDIAGSLICIISIKYGLSWMMKKFSKPPPPPVLMRRGNPH